MFVKISEGGGKGEIKEALRENLATGPLKRKCRNCLLGNETGYCFLSGPRFVQQSYEKLNKNGKSWGTLQRRTHTRQVHDGTKEKPRRRRDIEKQTGVCQKENQRIIKTPKGEYNERWHP